MEEVRTKVVLEEYSVINVSRDVYLTASGSYVDTLVAGSQH